LITLFIFDISFLIFDFSLEQQRKALALFFSGFLNSLSQPKILSSIV